jgi:hypothetical protein
MEDEKTTHNNEIKNVFNQKSIAYYSLGLIVIILTAISVYIVTTNNSKRDISNKMFVYTNIFLAATGSENIQNLTNTSADLQDPNFIKLNDQFEKMWSASKNTGIRWIYSMFLKDNEFVFGPDSVPFGSFGYVDPGYVYNSIVPEEKDILIKNVLEGGKDTVTGPYTDEWGTWISFFVPIVSTSNQKVIGILGTDMNYNEYQSIIFKDQLFILISFILLIIIYTLIFLYIHRINKNKQKLSEMLDREKSEIDQLKKLNDIAVDRELKMLSLKKEITELKDQK